MNADDPLSSPASASYPLSPISNGWVLKSDFPAVDAVLQVYEQKHIPFILWNANKANCMPAGMADMATPFFYQAFRDVKLKQH